MILPLRIGLASAKQSLPEILVGGSSLAVIEEIVDDLPDVMSALGFEIRLADDDSRVDFGTVLYAEDLANWQIARPNSYGTSGGTIGPWPADWWRVSEFIHRWHDPMSRLHDQVARLFLEFDLDSPMSGIPIPCVFVTLDEWAWQRGSIASSLLQVANESLVLLAGAERAAQEEHSLRTCLGNLPPGSMLLHVGVLLSRPGCPVRFCGWMPPALLPGYLESIRAPIDLELVQAFCELQASPVTFQLTLDKGRIATALDIEWHFRAQPPAETRWAALLDAMIQRGLCSSQKGEALLSFPGLAVESMGSTRGYLVLRAVSHVKASLRGSNGFVGKAYLTLAPARATEGL